MKPTGLSEDDLLLIQGVLARHPDVTRAILYGSRAKGSPSPTSDIDLALAGTKDALKVEAIASELEDLPLPYRFDVRGLQLLTHAPLLEHILRVGIPIYEDGGARRRSG